MLGEGAAYAKAGIVDLAWARLVRSGVVFGVALPFCSDCI